MRSKRTFSVILENAPEPTLEHPVWGLLIAWHRVGWRRRPDVRDPCAVSNAVKSRHARGCDGRRSRIGNGPADAAYEPAQFRRRSRQRGRRLTNLARALGRAPQRLGHFRYALTDLRTALRRLRDVSRDL